MKSSERNDSGAKTCNEWPDPLPCKRSMYGDTVIKFILQVLCRGEAGHAHKHKFQESIYKTNHPRNSIKSLWFFKGDLFFLKTSLKSGSNTEPQSVECRLISTNASCTVHTFYLLNVC